MEVDLGGENLQVQKVGWGMGRCMELEDVC